MYQASCIHKGCFRIVIDKKKIDSCFFFQFDLGCQDWKRSLVGTVHNAGFFISIPLTGLMSDKFGRRMALVFASVLNGVFGLIRALSSNYNMFIVFEFLEPAFGAGVYTACFVLGEFQRYILVFRVNKQCKSEQVFSNSWMIMCYGTIVF
jgi:MFS family permease